MRYKMEFNGSILLYEYKKIIISLYFNKSNINNIDENANKHRKDNHSLEETINYFIFSAILRNLVICSCSKLKIIFNFRRDLHIPIFIKNHNRSKSKKFFEMCEEFKKNIDKINDLLKYRLKEMNHKIISTELCYIISNFFNFTEIKIPYDLRKIIKPEFDINVLAKKLESGYKFLNLVHPLILSLTKNNHFKISYFSSIICNRLGFFEYELKNKDFHDKLFPGIRFVKQHELLMKQFLFFNSNWHMKKDSFIKTKEGYLQGIKLTSKKFPTFYDDFFLIIGLDFNDELFLSEINKKFNRYTFLLDENFDFISQTKNFYEDFEFNTNMFKEIKINFFEFFCVDKNIFNEKIKKQNSDFLKNNSVNNIINLKKEDDAFALFKSISYEKAYELRDISKIESLKNTHIIIRDKISKDKILKMIPEFSKLIEEYGLDFEWYQRMDNLNERLSIKEISKDQENLFEYSNKMIFFYLNNNNVFSNNSSKNINLVNKSSHREKQIQSKESKNFNNINNHNKNFDNNIEIKNFFNYSFMSNYNINNNENNEKKGIENYSRIKIILDRNFDVIFNLKKIGTIYFYIVDLYEKTLYKKFSHDSLIYEQKNKKQSLKLINNNKDKENKLIKAKTLFSNESKKNKNFHDFIKVKNILIEEKSLIEDEDDNVIQKVKSWESENNSIDMQKHLIKEGERIFNNSHILKVDIKADKISTSSEEYDNNRKMSTKKNRTNMKKQTLKDKKKRIIKEIIDNKNNYNRINNSINKNNEKEKIPFITKDILEEFIKNSNTFNFYYIFIIFILFFSIIIIIAIKLSLAKINFSFASYITNAMIYLEEIKTDIYTGSIITLSQCFRTQVNDIPSGTTSFTFQLEIKASDLMEHLNAFEKQLKLSKNYKLISNIMNYLYQNITIFRLNPDWTTKVEESYLLQEINYFSYLLNEESKEKEENIKCDFENNFYLYFLHIEDYINSNSNLIYFINNKKETSFNQRFLFYIIINIIYKISPVLYNILEEIVTVQIKTMDTYLKEIIVIDSILIFLIFLAEIAIFLKNMLDINFIKHNFLFLYDYDQNQLQFEYEINYLEITAKEFNLNNLIQLENIKKYNKNYINPNNPNEIVLNDIKNNNENNSKIRESLIDNEFENNKENKKSNLFEIIIHNNQKIGNNFDQNSISGSFFNNSHNSSMIQLLNKNRKEGIDQLKIGNNQNKEKTNNFPNNKNNQILKKEINNNKYINGENQILEENEETFEMLKRNNNLIPSSIFISIYFSLIFFSFLIVTISFDIIDIHKKRDIWEYAINLSLNYLDKIPKIIELGLSTYVTIFFSSSELIEYYSKEEYPNHQPIYMTYFTKMKNYENSEIISSNIKDSIFTNKLYDNYRIKKNIEFCGGDEFFKKYFKGSKFLNKKLNEENLYCINSSAESLLFFNKWIVTLDSYFEIVNEMAIMCNNENEKMNDSGLDLEINFILHELTYLYIDFEERMKTNITFARQKLFEDEKFNRMLRDMNIPFTFAAGSLFFYINEDMSQLNKEISFHAIFSIIITYIINGVIIFFVIVMVYSNEKNKNVLVFVGKILKKE